MAVAVSIFHALSQQRMHTHQWEQLSCIEVMKPVTKTEP